MTVADLVKRTSHRLGVEVTRHRPYAARRMRRIEEAGIRTVLDVGANTGQYGRALRAGGYRGRIVSLEPLGRAFSQLFALADRDPLWDCYRVAAGERTNEALLHVASNLASSSLLAMRPDHRSGAPTVTYVAEEPVFVAPLDEVVPALDPPALLKLDTQGYELHALTGAERTLDSVALVECEVSVADLYEGQPSVVDVLSTLAARGFELCDLDPFFYDPADGRVLAFDGLFRRV